MKQSKADCYIHRTSGVMSTLKMLFGQPEVIVHSMMSKINSLPALREDKLEAIVDFAVSVENFCATVDACGLEEHFYNMTFLHQLVNKLPPSIKSNWAQYRLSLPTVNLPSFSSWLYSLAEAASAVTIPNTTLESKTLRNDSRTAKKSNSFVNAHTQEVSKRHRFAALSNVKTAADSCLVCKGSCKSITKCTRFLEFSRDSRWATVRDLGLCRRCLGQHKGGCQAKLCGKNGCELKHHELLHNDQKNTSLPLNTLSTDTSKLSPIQRQEPIPAPNLGVAPLLLHGKHRSIETFAFLDDGSELTLLDKELADELQLEGDAAPLCLLWTGGAKRREDDSKNVKLEIGSKHDSKMYTMQGVRTVAELLLPTQSLNVEELSELYQHLKGLPITSYQDVRPRILSGMKDQHLSLVKKSREGALHEPIAVKTRLAEEDRAQNLLEGRTVLEGKRYETGLLWRYDNVRLPDSFPMALRRLQCLKKRMDKDFQLADALNKKIIYFVKKGYARKVTDKERSKNFPRTWYLPIFPVTNANKPGKIRMVWDAAAVAHGISLNSALLKGPDQLSALFTILVQFREGRVSLTGDVREMFLQVLMRPEDQQCQRFLWYDEDGTLSIYVLQVMTFGACCSPSSAQFVKNLSAKRFKWDYPAVEVIQRHYVDDMLVSVATEKEAVELALQVKEVHAAGGFEIRNWISNSKRVAEALEENNTEEKKLDLSPELDTEKVLELQAALIGSRLARTPPEALTIHITRRVFWSDSQDILC
ncbi:uncharacterized protein LOC134222521 [Armigeres subalbatus]|uniref:uncharacterized protein LOC134222521 n=1 Tax=Armigeres subalbatus TaxID=124917 RepID=UPI002ED48AE3